MNTRLQNRLLLGIGVVLGCATMILALEPSTVQWGGTDVRGAKVTVPQAGRTSVLLFVMAEQARSQDLIKQVATLIHDRDAFQVIVVLSGEQAAAQAAKLNSAGECPWPIVPDPDYTASGTMAVRVWPTTLLVQPSGEVLAHLAGLPKAYAKDLESYLSFAAGKIDRAALEQRLIAHDLVADDPSQVAARHLRVAQRLADKGLLDQARAELATAMKLQPASTGQQLTITRILIIVGEPDAALKVLAGIDATSVPPWQLAQLKGAALLKLGHWEEARSALADATTLNPQPAEPWYQLGLVYEHLKDPARAAEAFRCAFESTDDGHRIAASGTK